MRRTPDIPDHGAADPAASGDPLRAIDAAAARLHAGFDELLRLTLQAQHWGGTPAAAGCTVADYLRFEAALPSWLAGQLESVAQRLPALPLVAELYWSGVVTFDQLARVVRVTAAHNGELLARLDAEAASLGAQLAEQGRLHAWADQVELLVEDMRAPGWRQRQERRVELGQRLVAQQDLDGGGFIGEWLDAPGFATRMASVDAETDPVAARANRRRARAEASVRIAALHLARTEGCDGRCDGCCTGLPGRPARPTFVVHVDLADATADRCGQLLRLAGGARGLPTLSARLLDALADHAELVVQVTQGRRPLLELVAKETDEVPDAIRRAVLRRDRGCRFPGCSRPVAVLQVHHVVWRSHGGTHDPDNLIALCSFHHLRYVHEQGWRPALDGVSGLVTWTNTRTGTGVATMPHGSRPPPLRDPSLLPDWLAPPRPPPPDTHDPPGPATAPDHWTLPPTDLHA